MNIRDFLLSSLRRVPLLLVALAAMRLPAQVMTLTDRHAAPVVVESAVIRTEVTDRVAVTTFELVFRNPNDRPLEGMFEFPLLDGQQVVGFALDINGRLRPAVPVEKERGRIVFEEIERRRVDPGLLERTAGNNYRARVFPIPARGTRQVSITYQENLGGAAELPVYRIPLNFRTPLVRFDLRIDVPTGAAAVQARTTLPLELPPWTEGRTLRVERTQFVAKGLVELQLPRLAQPKTMTERRGEAEYFYTEVPVTGLEPANRPTPRVVGLLWDASGSGDERDHERELATLHAWFARVPDVEVRVVVFRDRAAAPVRFKVEKGNWTALRRELEKTVYDGATSFEGLVDDPDVQEWLLFSDGLVNYGSSQDTAALSLRRPVHAILSGIGANPAFLRGVASRHHGEFVNLLETDAREAARFLRSESIRVLDVEPAPGQAAEVYPEPGAPVREGGFVVAGLLKAPVATVRLRIGHAQATREIDVTVRSGENAGRLAARLWATNKIASLEPDAAANRDDIRRTSREFGVVTADTSLIVLETLEDYIRYDIAPPEELRRDWESRRQMQLQIRQKGRDSRLDRLAALFQDKIDWWETRFPLPLPYAEPRRSPIQSFSSAHTSASGVSPGGAPAAGDRYDEKEDILILSPFEVRAEPDTGYTASSTLAGTRLRTDMRSLRPLISVVAGSVTQDVAAANASEPWGQVSAAPEAEESVRPSNQPGSTELRRWEAKAGYLDRLRRAAPARRYGIYLEERADRRREPGFYLDVAGFLFEAGDAPLALRILSNLAELQLDHPSVLRVLAHRLMDANQPALALPLFERVLELRKEEPQSRRDLALACAALQQYQRAVDLLWALIAESENSRFAEIELIALGEMNAIIANHGAGLDLGGIDPRLRRNLPTGLRVVLSWDTDACDIDLWVDDPVGQRASYERPLTWQGGRMSRDFTDGYGPEEFLLRNPKPGKYTVHINYYGDRRQTELGPVTAQIRL
ncbi:MAG TPA: VIT domain-containing protein, partial [Lacunisphaera sp.]|nr:VIT domain-containing protein [Lacunisphaera sp.]